MPKLEQFEIKKYWQIFSGLKPVDQKVNHDQVLPILYNSKQDSSVLNKIWFLADIDDDDSLDFEEFVICMRLIFDMVNKNIDKVPDELPEWLIPGSKAKLVKERIKRKAEEQESMPPQKEPPKMDWYMTPEDVETYTKILDESNRSSRDGTVTYPSLSLSIKNKFFNIGSSDMEKIWKLVNPRNLNSIDKDPALYFIHLLRQRNDVGALIPSDIPTALANVFNKQEIQYDLKSEQAQVRRTTTIPTASSLKQENTIPDKKIETNNDTIQNSYSSSSGSKSNGNSVGKIDTHDLTLEKARLIRQQLEGLLKYRKDKYGNGNNLNSSNYNINSFKDDLGNIEQQYSELTNYLNQKKVELNSIKEEINALS